MSVFCIILDNPGQNNIDYFENVMCNVVNSMNNKCDRKKLKKGRHRFPLFCIFCSTNGHKKERCFKRPQRESQ